MRTCVCVRVCVCVGKERVAALKRFHVAKIRQLQVRLSVCMCHVCVEKEKEAALNRFYAGKNTSAGQFVCVCVFECVCVR